VLFQKFAEAGVSDWTPASQWGNQPSDWDGTPWKNWRKREFYQCGFCSETQWKGKGHLASFDTSGAFQNPGITVGKVKSVVQINPSVGIVQAAQQGVRSSTIDSVLKESRSSTNDILARYEIETKPDSEGTTTSTAITSTKEDAVSLSVDSFRNDAGLNVDIQSVAVKKDEERNQAVCHDGSLAFAVHDQASDQHSPDDQIGPYLKDGWSVSLETSDSAYIPFNPNDLSHQVDEDHTNSDSYVSNAEYLEKTTRLGRMHEITFEECSMCGVKPILHRLIVKEAKIINCGKIAAHKQPVAISSERLANDYVLGRDQHLLPVGDGLTPSTRCGYDETTLITDKDSNFGGSDTNRFLYAVEHTYGSRPESFKIGTNHPAASGGRCT